ncbi:MAG: VCBS repeat-containing protein [Puniceicoccales bacterium]|jgi:hypothetical protein|nr:VCBS repeat-containing protein [Puniceicoccales bacterium]
MKHRLATLRHFAALTLIASAGLAAAPDASAAAAPKYKKLVLSNEFYSEGAHFGDFNKDGITDVAAGPFWFEGPDFKRRHSLHTPKVFDLKKHPRIYSDVFTEFGYDINGDGWEDIFICPHPGTRGYWFENPKGAETPWKKHFFANEIGNESPQWLRMRKTDPHPALLYNRNGRLGFSTFVIKDGAPEWTFHPVSNIDNRRYERYTHGVGAGDINGDGRIDILENEGWWEHPADEAAPPPWKFHKYKPAETPAAAAAAAGKAADGKGAVGTDGKTAGSAKSASKRNRPRFAAAASHMYVLDVNGDGLNDVVTAWDAHIYGLVWHEQVRSADGEITWRRHEILPVIPDLASPALRISQMHAVAIADMNGDGLPDIVTGKRFWAHGPDGDKEASAPAVLYWFELKRGKEFAGGATFIPHKIDDDSGVSTQLTVADINKDKVPDIIVSSKKGIFVFLSE